MSDKEEGIRLFKLYFLKLELAFLVPSVLAGMFTTMNYGWVSGLKMCLGIFLFVQPFFVYVHKDVLIAIWKERRNQKNEAE